MSMNGPIIPCGVRQAVEHRSAIVPSVDGGSDVGVEFH